jgi:hypothetical protein
MPGTGAGWDSIFYRVYVIGGLLGIVVLELCLGFLAPEVLEANWLLLAVGPVTLWFVGILAYWWIQLLFRGYGDPRRMPDEEKDGIPEIKSLRSWSRLSEAMTVHGGDMEELVRLEKAARRPVLEWYGWVNVLVLFCLSNPWLMGLGILTPQTLRYFVAGVLGLIILIMVRTYFLLGTSIGAGEHAYLRPLGLAVVETPTVDFGAVGRMVAEGPWGLVAGRSMVLEGTRHGRRVQVVIDGKKNYTMVKAHVPRFTVESREGKLIAGEGTPPAAEESLRELRKARRWVGVELQGGPEGIAVERTPGRKQNMWLYDLWLSERLLDALGQA